MSGMLGGCACGAVRYEIEGAPMGVGVCYCRDCQYATGGPPTYVALVPRPAFKLTKGEPRRFTSKADSGKDVTRVFCADCGTPLYSDPEDGPMLPVKVGGLDDPSGLTPGLAIYTASAQPWHLRHEGIPSFEKMPGG